MSTALATIHEFLAGALSNPQARWNADGLANIAARSTPDLIMGVRSLLLRADMHLLWARWFVEAICDPEPFVQSYQGYAYVCAKVLPRVDAMFVGVPQDERAALGTQIARLLDAEIRRRQERQRLTSDLDTRQTLWEIAGPEPRCWICGYQFEQWAVDRFLRSKSAFRKPFLPLFVDYMKPQGLKERDFRIEIDHVMPIADGGDNVDNLRLACGWCNAHKGERTSLYDVGAKPFTILHTRRGKTSAPRPFWVVRLLATRRRCEWDEGCEKTVVTASLTVAPKYVDGAMNPTNLRVTCLEHDPLGADRLVRRDIVQPMSLEYST